MIILGIHGGVTNHQHDAGAAIVVDGSLVSFVEEERLSRQKSATGLLPIRAISQCLTDAGVSLGEVDLVAVPGSTYDMAEVRTSQWLRHHFGISPSVLTVNHQSCHLASTFYPSGFDDAICISMDFTGDRLSGAVAYGCSSQVLEVKETFELDQSLGLFYATMTSYLGFKPGEDEYKVMGLAAYGNPTIDLSSFLRVREDHHHVDLQYFNPSPNRSQYEPYYSDALIAQLGPNRLRGAPISQFYKDVAASTQHFLEQAILAVVRRSIGRYRPNSDPQNICLAGGVALNCSANRIVADLSDVRRLYIAPPASDRGLALGAALFEAGKHSRPNVAKHMYWGPKGSASLQAIEGAIDVTGSKAVMVDRPEKIAAALLGENKLVGWFQGRSEMGPRALGNRSIFANPTHARNKDHVNARVKFREDFRPFAPAIVAEASAPYFVLSEKVNYDYMTVACQVTQQGGAALPATTHVNNTARLQTVTRESNALFYGLLEECSMQYGVPAVLNTSFNVMGQPIVETAREAIATFASSGLDALFLGPYMISK